MQAQCALGLYTGANSRREAWTGQGKETGEGL
jgi:hypothetical protein